MISVEEQDTFINQNHQTRFSNCQCVPQTPLLPIYRQAHNAHRDSFLWNKLIPSLEGIEGAKEPPHFENLITLIQRLDLFCRGSDISSLVCGHMACDNYLTSLLEQESNKHKLVWLWSNKT